MEGAKKMEVDVVENEDGSATLNIDMSDKEAELLIEYAILKILKDGFKKMEAVTDALKKRD